ncbi:MAG TPA: hypothetical protein PLR94_05315 [Accumulibacter sp.]|nr:hypothetical protein [Accumulibacter sp.]MDS4054058.1 hypothetical protein [Accumulibacter sp.]HMW62298.1 hypothetical protein [Accumulibacter sp.]HMX68463.1 hypothetical protein [Accumulibacter sp.]HNB69082.1 hypothetical protein [Accumulibacter sp.]HNC26662.1 hypothetical protein [Accumulibacter sp.]
MVIRKSSFHADGAARSLARRIVARFRRRRAITMSDPTHATTVPGGAEMPARGEHLGAQLPTLQRNALRKIFGRREFTPQDVALLGYRRIEKAEGIGKKGLFAIRTWLQQFGYDVAPPENPAAEPAPQVSRRVRIERAVRLLTVHGYTVDS